MLVGDKLLNTPRHNGAYPNPIRDLSGVLYRRGYYVPPGNPIIGARLFFVNGHGTLRRSDASIAASAAAVEAAREAGENEITSKQLASRPGINGYCILFGSSLADRKRCPNLSCLWSLRHSALQYDPMRVILSKVI